ncbi:hypothetical protein [Acidiphilium acidophilum]|uniref:Lytic murein transglycosylase n=1 Tax=Acidiphilium acidophilum TaxID=76588 RepID=A0AAW9DTE9_ACIAO|nr:hypothetical protein [Acidiphilium acidophilum]MDX5932471.1 hypothetical protein [Acidiphilium acidophilum]
MAVLAWPRRLNKAGHVAKLLVLALVVFLPTQAKAGARSDLRRAWQSWLAHDDRRAASLYAIGPGWAARMGEGDSLYRLGNYIAAALRKIALLHDQRIPVIASLLRADNRDAANVLGQSR